jgi:subtilisin family serine protease
VKSFLQAFFLLFLLIVNQATAKPEIVPGQLYVKLKPQAARFKSVPGPLQQTLAQYGIELRTPVWTAGHQASQLRLKQTGRVTNPEAEVLAEGFSRTWRVKTAPGVDVFKAARHLSQLPEIEYAEPVYLHRTTSLPNDPRVGTTGHRYFATLGFDVAFASTQGSESVIIAIVDSGVDYQHPDLEGKMWRNTREIENNGIDDDGNGFVDDVIGWDFWESGDLITTWEQDNDPMGTGSDHGTHVAGTAAARTNNGIGIAGTGYNSRYMAVKAGGTIGDPTAIGFGYEGILYAVNNGAHVINNSWAGPNPSFFGRDIIAYAVASNVVVVCAASNENRDQMMYPASFPGALSVAALGSNSNEISRVKASYSNYNYRIDVAATGTNVISTIFSFGGTERYGSKSGTSMASPVVAGLAGLIRARYPEWNAERVTAQIRAAATNIDNDQTASQQSTLRNKLGNGMINAGRAVTKPLPGIIIAKQELVTPENIKPRPGQNGILRLTLRNAGEAAPITINATVLQGDLTATFGSQTLDFPTGDERVISIPIAFGQNAASGTSPAIRVNFTNAGLSYSDFRVVQIDDFLYDVHNNSNVQTSLAADGTMGFQNPDDPMSGVGFQYLQPNGTFSENFLYESGLIISINGTIYNRARGTRATPDNHFRSQELFRIRRQASGVQTGFGTFDFSGKADAPNVLVTQESFTFPDGHLRNTLIVRYKIANNGTTPLSNVYVGIFSDWDVGNYSRNNAGFLAPDTIMYLYEPGNNTLPKVATVPYRKLSSMFAINNGNDGDGPLDFGIYYDKNSTQDPNNGFSDTEKNWALTNGLQRTTFESVDIASVVASGPYNISAGGSVTVAFIHAAAITTDGLIAAVQAARQLNIFELSTSTEGKIEPTRFALNAVYPNPFNPVTNIHFELPASGTVSLKMFNILGQQVLSIPARRFSPGSHILPVNASGLGSGVYLLRLETTFGTAVQRVTLVK